ncbi:hypothetical protein [Paenibacillus sp. FSL M7-1046]|uniref:hypothetical protein n=1 Tax=Paenibacillus sp. FSL M7-1046 TaxID=2975315 RepID=UPI0030FCE324
MSGNDDKNLLLAFTSPLLLWFEPQLTELHQSMKSELLWQYVLYGIHFFSWLFIALIIDWGISRYRAAKNNN